MRKKLDDLLQSRGIKYLDWSYFGYGKYNQSKEDELYILEKLEPQDIRALADLGVTFEPRNMAGEACIVIGW